ncbi:MAG: hypothetical protein ABW292_10280, partial [Vicinamibacterales bacterium]
KTACSDGRPLANTPAGRRDPASCRTTGYDEQVSREAGRRGRQRTYPSKSNTRGTPLGGRAARPAEPRYLLVAAGV